MTISSIVFGRTGETGELDNTIIIVTSDNGMPFPRSKGNNYEYSNHMPLAVMWKMVLPIPEEKSATM